MWRRHGSAPNPSHHALRATCNQLLPLVEMFLKWELQEDCSNLHALMLRFDSERELQSHELGRSMLQMLRDDDTGLQILPPRIEFGSPSNPFDDIRSRLAAVDASLQAMQPQVHLAVGFIYSCSIPGTSFKPLYTASWQCSHCPIKILNNCLNKSPFIAHLVSQAICFAWLLWPLPCWRLRAHCVCSFVGLAVVLYEVVIGSQNVVIPICKSSDAIHFVCIDLHRHQHVAFHSNQPTLHLLAHTCSRTPLQPLFRSVVSLCYQPFHAAFIFPFLSLVLHTSIRAGFPFERTIAS